MSNLSAQFARDVVAGLRATPKVLPPKYFYDDLGSAIFDAICELPWYAVTRAELRLLPLCARTLSRTVKPKTIIELGPGSGEKLGLLAAAMGRGLKQLHLVDVSKAALNVAEAFVARASRAAISTHVATFEAGTRGVILSRTVPRPILVTLLGSTIANYEPDAARELIATLGRHLGPDDRLLLGADLVKRAEALRLAYDDPLGITAAFNKNLLVRINRELDANFKLERFEHRVVWNSSASRIEMHLVSLVAQVVQLRRRGVRITFRRGESIWTESSYKFQPRQLARLGQSAALQVSKQWINHRDKFALTLYQRPKTPLSQ